MVHGGKPLSAMVQANDDNRLDTVWLNARLATLIEGRPGLGVVESGAIGAREGRIAFVGPKDELPFARAPCAASSIAKAVGLRPP